MNLLSRLDVFSLLMGLAIAGLAVAVGLLWHGLRRDAERAELQIDSELLRP